ncbi:MAG: hypothetical protein HY365_02470 [Candidatus Aenigmarchaeota archaeon]|nr:hypothetical protein [Candidatus Aenigmarchaeota archaeon]
MANWRIGLLVAAVVLSVVSLFMGAGSGFSVETSSTPRLSVGDTVYAINGAPPPVSGNYSGLVQLATQRGAVYIETDGPLPFTLKERSSTNLEFGLDITGGVSATVKPKNASLASDVIPVLQQRINFYGLREATFRTIDFHGDSYVEVAIAGGTEDEIRRLLEAEGKFEAKVPLKASKEIIMDKSYPISVNGTLSIENKSYAPGDSFILAGVPFIVANITGSDANVVATVYGGDDIQAVYLDPARSGVRSLDNNYQWSFGLQVSPKAANNFAMVTKNLPFAAGTSYLQGEIAVYLDDKLINSFQIASSLRGNAATSIEITGTAPSYGDALAEKRSISSILRSGSLPTSIEIVGVSSVSPTLGRAFVNDVLLAGVAAAAGVAAVVLARYRRPKIILPMLAVSLSEALIILGAAAAFSWTLDLPALAGIIAAIGTGVDSQIIMIDQSSRRKELTLTEQLKRAFFVIFGSGGILIASMLPLLTMISLRGFAITTIIGVLIGVLITRPAFGEILKKIERAQ